MREEEGSNVRQNVCYEMTVGKILGILLQTQQVMSSHKCPQLLPLNG